MTMNILKKLFNLNPTKPEKDPADLTGEGFHCLTVIRLDRKDGDENFWLCQCACGNRIIAKENLLKAGLTPSCGCHNENYENTLFEYVGNWHSLNEWAAIYSVDSDWLKRLIFEQGFNLGTSIYIMLFHRYSFPSLGK